jgi:hypothetical protein
MQVLESFTKEIPFWFECIRLPLLSDDNVKKKLHNSLPAAVTIFGIFVF